MNKKLLILPILLNMLFAVSCNKEKDENTDDKNTVTATPDIIQDGNSDDTVSAVPSPDESITGQDPEEYIFINSHLKNKEKKYEKSAFTRQL